MAGYTIDSDPELTQLVVAGLLEDRGADAVAALEEAVPIFVDEHEPKLRSIYDEYRGSSRHVLLFQPEAILVFMKLDSDAFDLSAVWERVLPVDELRALANVWGEALPESG